MKNGSKYEIPKIFTPSEVEAQTGVSFDQLVVLAREQRLLPAYKTSKGKWFYTQNEIDALLASMDSHYALTGKYNIAYIRVNDESEATSIQLQKEEIAAYCHKHRIKIDKVFIDIGSGMDATRPGFNKLLGLVIQRRVGIIVVAATHRFVRTNFITMKKLLKCIGVEIIPLQINDPYSNKEVIEDVRDMINSVTKIYPWMEECHKVINKHLRSFQLNKREPD